MAHVRVFRHYIHTPYILVALGEAVLFFVSAYLGYYLRFGVIDIEGFAGASTIFALIMVSSMVAMGVYGSRLREGYTGMMLRTGVACFLLGTTLVAVLSYLVPELGFGRGVFIISMVVGFILVTVSRWLTANFIDEDALKNRVVVLGVGNRATKIASRMRRKSDRRAFVLLGFIDVGGGEDCVREFGARVLPRPESLKAFCVENEVDEIVIAVDERRRGAQDNTPGLPIEELVDCRFVRSRNLRGTSIRRARDR